MRIRDISDLIKLSLRKNSINMNNSIFTFNSLFLLVSTELF